MSAVWVDIEDNRILVDTAEGRAKPSNVRRDPRVAISIAKQDNPHASAVIRGRIVEITHEGAEEPIDGLAKEYIGQDRYPWRQPDERRVKLVIEPKHVNASMAS